MRALGAVSASGHERVQVGIDVITGVPTLARPEMAEQHHHLVVERGHMLGVAVPVSAQGGSELRSSLVGEEQARTADLDYLVCSGNGVA